MNWDQVGPPPLADDDPLMRVPEPYEAPKEAPRLSVVPVSAFPNKSIEWVWSVALPEVVGGLDLAAIILRAMWYMRCISEF